MKKYKYSSLIHQYYKELKKAYSMGYPIIPLCRIFFKYLVQNRIKRDRLEMGIPWLVKDVVNFLEKNIKEGQLVFEYGSGASSYYFLKNGLKLVSVEHDKDWYEKVKSFLLEKGFLDFSLNLIEPEDISPERPKVSSEKDPRFKGYDYSKYSKFISSFPDDHFDIILIDGRVRIECLRNSMAKLKHGGLLVFDNTERKNYADGLNSINLNVVLRSFGFVDYDLGFTETSVFRK